MTGHTSLLIAAEVVADLAMKVAKPVLKGQAEEVEVARKAEVEYRKFIDDGHKHTVWQSGFCTSVSVLLENPRSRVGVANFLCLVVYGQARQK